MRKPFSPLALVALSWLSIFACDGGLPTDGGSTVPPSLTRNARAAELRLFMTLSDTTGTPELAWQATLIPGRNPVTNDTLEVLGTPFPGRGPFAEGTREYGGQVIELDEAVFRKPVEVVAPGVGGVSPTRPTLRLAPVGREGSAVVDVEPESLPVLNIVGPVGDPLPGARVTWVVEVRPEGEEIRRIFGVGGPPGRIPIPRMVLPEGVRVPTEVRLWYTVARGHPDLPDGAYRVTTFFQVVIGWSLHPDPGP